MATRKLHEVKKAVILYRLSKAKPNQTKDETRTSALGLAAQKTYVRSVLAPFNPEIITEVVEVESATRKAKFQLSKRPDLVRALQLCQHNDATLVISTADRLVRNEAFGHWLVESDIPFVCCDDPDMNPLVLSIKLASAAEEGRKISKRVTDALAEAKARGVKLGAARPGHFHNGKYGPDGKWIPGNMHLRGSLKGCKVMAEKRSQRARERYTPLFPTMKKLIKRGEPLRVIAETLNADKMRTTRFASFSEPTLHRIIKRYRSDIMGSK